MKKLLFIILIGVFSVISFGQEDTSIIVKASGYYDNVFTSANFFPGQREMWFAVVYLVPETNQWCWSLCVTRNPKHFPIIRQLHRDVRDFTPERISVTGSLSKLVRTDEKSVYREYPVIIVKKLDRNDSN